MADRSTADAPSAYEDLLDQYRRIVTLEDAEDVLTWDQQVVMPPGGTPARSNQLSTVSGLAHELLTDEGVADRLAGLRGADLSPEQSAVVREIRRRHERAARVPQSLVEDLSERSSDALSVWERAKAEDDYAAFEPVLDDLVELRREYAAHVDPDADPYAVLFAEYEPYLGIDTAERVLARLREELVPLIDAVSDRHGELASPFAGGTYPEADQEAVARAILDDLGYDWDRGRLDTSSHPFTAGNQFDCRITTRFNEADPLEALTATIHEFGHATYNLGLPRDRYGSPLGEARNLVVHESQSRLWENHVGRTRAFWERTLPTLTEHFDGLDAVDADAVYEAANRIYPDNLIRVEADELTYHMHIVLRFEIERDLIRGDLDAAEVPAVWDEKMEDYLGVRPDSDAEGCLQDIHWSRGNFGYFPTYSLGSVLAAQLDHHLAADIGDVSATIGAGDFDAIRDWLRAHVHRHGRRYETDDLIEAATGEPFTAEYFVEYVTEKFGELYGL